MKRFRLTSAVCAAVFGFITLPSHAALVARDLDGNLTTAEAYYDTIADLTWLADANAAGTTMNWADANAWAASLDINGVTGWRLPSSLNSDGSGPCGPSFYCTDSEMGNLFHSVLGGTAGYSITTTHNSNYDLFSNVQSRLVLVCHGVRAQSSSRRVGLQLHWWRHPER